MKEKHPLQRWLDREELTFEAFAEQVGLTRQTVGNIVRGRPVSWRSAQAVEAATGGAVKALRLVQQGRAA